MSKLIIGKARNIHGAFVVRSARDIMRAMDITVNAMVGRGNDITIVIYNLAKVWDEANACERTDLIWMCCTQNNLITFSEARAEIPNTLLVCFETVEVEK